MTELPRPSRPLTDDERAAFLAAQAERVTAQLRRLRDECDDNPALMITYGFATVEHPVTAGLMSYLHDETRHEAARQIRQRIAEIAMGRLRG